jgi:hypothetical protein
LDATALSNGPAQLAGCLLQLTQSDFWMEQSARSRDAFEYWQRKEPPAQRLKRKLDQIAFRRPGSRGDDKYTEQTTDGAA